ncbi:MAG TPA: hypothetical protein VF316_17520 [Polyangiaceae bacterium]
MTRRLAATFAVALGAVAALGCGKLFGHRHETPDAGVFPPKVDEPVATTATDAGVDIDAMLAMMMVDPVLAAGGDAGCPEPIRPGYCRRNCRTYASRQATKHARRVSKPTRHAFGTCGRFKVFAEDDKSGGGLVEYYDASGGLVGAVDRRQKACGQYGTIPTCKLELKWEPSPTITDAPPTVIDDDDGL